MRALLAALLLVSLCSYAAPSHALGPTLFTQSGIAITGPGCTTAFYRDYYCKPCGVGMKASGTYPLQTGTLPTQATPPFWTTGDTPDADPLDPTVCTKAQWQAKWGWTTPDTANDNTAMQSFVQQRKGLPAGSNIYYLSQSGVDSTCGVNDPSKPCATMGKILPQIQAAVTQEFSGTATTVSGSNQLSVTACSVGTLKRGDLLNSGNGIPAGTYVIEEVTSPSSCVGSYWMTQNANASLASRATTGSYQNGGVIVVRGGAWTNNALSMSPASPNPAWQLSGSRGHPLLIMAYPGEVVDDKFTDGSQAVKISGSAAPGRASCCLIIDGIEFDSTQNFDLGNGIFGANYEDLTVQNVETAGFNDNEVGQNSKNIKWINSVFHETGHHSIYMTFGVTSANPNFASSQCSIPAAGDFDFALDQANFLNGKSCGAIYQTRELGNNFYDGGTGGFDMVHNNAWILATFETGNIMAFEGGNQISMQGGNYATSALGNLLFDNGGECISLVLGPQTTGNGPASHRYGVIANNICYQIDPSLFVWGKQVISAVSMQSQTCPPVGSTSGSVFTLSTAGCTGIGQGMLMFGPGISANTSILPYGSNGTTGLGTGPGALALSQPVTASEPGGTSFVTKNPLGNAISNITLTGNLIVTTDNGQALCSLNCTNPIPIDFEYNSNPETATVTGNQFWSAGSSSGRMMVVSSDASTAGIIPPGNYTSFAAFSARFPGNTYLSGNPFANASSAIYQTPGAFDFSPHLLH